MLTKAQIRSLTREYLDDPNAKRWSDANIDLAIQLIYDDLYSDILDNAGYFNSAYQQIPLPLHTPGYIALSQTMYGGDLTQRFYRMQHVVADGREYFPKDPRDYLMVATGALTGTIADLSAQTGSEQRYSYQFLGNQVWLHPLGLVTTTVEIRYSYRPITFTSLTNGYGIELPEGSENVLILLAAATTMSKGNAEEAKQLMELGEIGRQKLLNSIRRQHHGMTQPFTTGNMQEWGGT